MAEVI